MEDRKDIFNNSNNKMPKGGKPRMFRFNLYWMYGLIFMMLIALYMTNDSSDSKELGWTEFQRLAQENVFEKITVYNKKNLVEATVKKDKQEQVFGTKDITKLGTSPKAYVKIPSADKFSDFYDKAVAENRIDTQVRFEEGEDMLWNFFVSFGPLILLFAVWMFLMRRMSGGAGAGPGSVDGFPGADGVFSAGGGERSVDDAPGSAKGRYGIVCGGISEDFAGAAVLL